MFSEVRVTIFVYKGVSGKRELVVHYCLCIRVYTHLISVGNQLCFNFSTMHLSLYSFYSRDGHPSTPLVAESVKEPVSFDFLLRA